MLRINPMLPFFCMDSEDDRDERAICAMQMFQRRVGNDAAIWDFPMWDTSSVEVA